MLLLKMFTTNCTYFAVNNLYYYLKKYLHNCIFYASTTDKCVRSIMFLTVFLCLHH